MKQGDPVVVPGDEISVPKASQEWTAAVALLAPLIAAFVTLSLFHLSYLFEIRRTSLLYAAALMNLVFSATIAGLAGFFYRPARLRHRLCDAISFTFAGIWWHGVIVVVGAVTIRLIRLWVAY